MGFVAVSLKAESSLVITFYRFFIGAICVVIFARVLNRPLRFVNRKLLLTRGLTGGVSVFFYYFSLSHLGLATGTLISNTYPLFVVGLGSLFLKEKASAWVWGLIVCALLGTGLMVDFHATKISELKANLFFILVSLVGAFLSASAVLAIKALTETDSPEIIFLSQCLFGIGLSFLPMLKHLSLPTLPTFYGFLATGLLAASGQILMTWSFKKVSLASGSMLGFVITLLSALIGLFYFGEKWSGHQFLGASLISLACLGLIFWEMRASKKLPVSVG